MALGSSALDGKREPEARRSGEAGQLSATGAPKATDDKSEPGSWHLLVVEVISALNDNYSPGAEQASGGGMNPGGQRSGVGTFGISTEPTAAPLTTAEQIYANANSAVAIQTAAAAKGNEAAQACDCGMKSGGKVA
jgi:hypothetical protein